MEWKTFLKDYLAFSRKERVAIIVVISLIFFIWLSPKILSNSRSGQTALSIDTSWVNQTKNLKPIASDMNKNEEAENVNATELTFEKSVDSKSPKMELFYFDPNKATPDEWKKLGIKEKTIYTIQNYLNKGGHFYKPSDLEKIYGLKPGDCARLESYVKIESQSKNHFTDTPNSDFKKIEQEPPVSRSKTIDINSADTTAFISLPGIGNKLASRIVNFREKLGGFYSIDQVGETYALADTTFRKIKKYLALSNATVKTFNINTATKDEMKSHPYMKWAIANAIVEFRNQHGDFSSLEDLKKISLITDEIFLKIKPYLAL